MIGFRAGPDIVGPLDVAAAAENAGRSEIIRRAVVAWLEANGYLRK